MAHAEQPISTDRLGGPTKDIGLELDMTVNAVRQAKFRVARKLRQLLDDDFTGLFGAMEQE